MRLRWQSARANDKDWVRCFAAAVVDFVVVGIYCLSFLCLIVKMQLFLRI